MYPKLRMISSLTYYKLNALTLFPCFESPAQAFTSSSSPPQDITSSFILGLPPPENKMPQAPSSHPNTKTSSSQ